MSFGDIPTLTTERLVLRAPVLDDFADYAKFLGSPRSRYMGGPFDTRAPGSHSATILPAGTCSGMER